MKNKFFLMVLMLAGLVLVSGSAVGRVPPACDFAPCPAAPSSPATPAPRRIIYEEKFEQAPTTGMAAAPSHICRVHPVFPGTAQHWNSASGSSNGIPFWVKNDGNTSYFYDSPIVTICGNTYVDYGYEGNSPNCTSLPEFCNDPNTGYPHYIYSGLMLRQDITPIRIERGKRYEVEFVASVAEWYPGGDDNQQAVISKIEAGISSIENGLAIASSFNALGGGVSMAIRNEPYGGKLACFPDPTDPENGHGGMFWLDCDGWQDNRVYRELGTGWFRNRLLIDTTDPGKLKVKYQLIRLSDGWVYQDFDIVTDDPRVVSAAQDYHFYIQAPQNKAITTPRENFRLKEFKVFEETPYIIYHVIYLPLISVAGR